MAGSPVGDSRFILPSPLARELAETYQTPLYVIDERHFRERIRRTRSAAGSVWPGAEISFAAKANSTLAVLSIAVQEGCLIDAASEGELRAALLAGAEPSRCHLHGNNKTSAEIEYAMEVGVGSIVVDNFDELNRIFTLAQSHRCPDLLLRLAPGVDPITHEKISTGQADTKFGFNIVNGAAGRAVRVATGLSLPLVGFHCHVGSQLMDAEAQKSGAEVLARFVVDMWRDQGFVAKALNVGGGLGIRYTDADDPVSIEDYYREVSGAVAGAIREYGFELKLIHEPGRSLVGESGVTLYRIGTVKTVPVTEDLNRTYVCVDGGLADNPRPALYGAKYTVLHIPDRTKQMGEAKEQAVPGMARGEFDTTYTISGRHCETDTLFRDILLPDDVEEGDLVQVLCTGAYNASMASNYNRYPRPAAVLIREDGSHELVQRRETWEEMFAREILPGGRDE
ncbi:MAG TPA: diaminopimelate decarboxylase [Fimbriimonadaceae bacterium]|nr:diaminopimelate decarboxylase [Fimbriimonadaceae bacterium]HRJ97237.1 diaminopimelate decarboxylase [Fimbriimonadaceae bacterium]